MRDRQNKQTHDPKRESQRTQRRISKQTRDTESINAAISATDNGNSAMLTGMMRNEGSRLGNIGFFHCVDGFANTARLVT